MGWLNTWLKNVIRHKYFMIYKKKIRQKYTH